MGEVLVPPVGSRVRWETDHGVSFGRVTAHQANFSGVAGLIVKPQGGGPGSETSMGLGKAQVINLRDPHQLKEWLGGSTVRCPDCDTVFRNQRALQVHQATVCHRISRLGLGDVAGVEVDEPLAAGVLVLVAGQTVNQPGDVYARVVKLGLSHHGQRCYDVRLGDTRVIKDVLEEEFTVVDMSDPTQLKRWLRHG